MTPKEEFDFQDARLRGLINRIPARVRDGSVQDAVNFKKDHANAVRILGKRGVKAWELAQASNELEKYQ
jgi:hypothetical protein